MTPCKIIGQISCTRKKGCLRNLKEDVQPGCMDCPEALTEITNLEGKTIYEYRSPEQRTGTRTKKTKVKKS